MGKYELFDACLMAVEYETRAEARPNMDATCKTCKHRQRWERGSRIIQYCGVRKSNRNHNGLMKIKVTYPACWAYEKEKKQ